jgi:DNA-binding transcriptional LysR family regulator
MTELDVEQLHTLAVAVSEGTFDAAARALHITPSAVSQRVKALESAVGRVLLIRAKPIRPTPSGQILLRAARQIETVTANAVHELGDRDGGGLPVIALAASADSLDTRLMPASVRPQRDRFPDRRRRRRGLGHGARPPDRPPSGPRRVRPDRSGACAESRQSRAEVRA